MFDAPEGAAEVATQQIDALHVGRMGAACAMIGAS